MCGIQAAGSHQTGDGSGHPAAQRAWDSAVWSRGSEGPGAFENGTDKVNDTFDQKITSRDCQ